MIDCYFIMKNKRNSCSSMFSYMRMKIRSIGDCIINMKSSFIMRTHQSGSLMALVVLALFINGQAVVAQGITTVEYVECFNESDAAGGITLPIVKKSERLKSNSAISFQIASEENVPDSVVKCLNVAADIWRSCLNISAESNIRLTLRWAELKDNEDIKTTVYYCLSPDGNNYPSSLYHILNPDSKRNTETDAIITVNKDIKWDCGYSVENNRGIRSLCYAMLRSIAVSLGFGSSLSKTALPSGEEVIRFPFTSGHSLFDNLLVAGNGMRLSELQNTGDRQNESILQYCTGQFGNVYIEGLGSANDLTYCLHTPPIYEESKSLVCLENPQSLMHHSLSSYNKILRIDPVTTNILNKMGWEQTHGQQIQDCG